MKIKIGKEYDHQLYRVVVDRISNGIVYFRSVHQGIKHGQTIRGFKMSIQNKDK